jgi:peroxiredoxin
MLEPISKTLKAGDMAPEFEVPAADRKMIHLSDFNGKPLVLIFIRGTW